MTETASLTICVFCGSSPGEDPAHLALATELGTAIAARGHKLVYGGGGLGLMGATARAARDGGANVIGVIPHFLNAIERTIPDIEHEFVDDMHARKIRMFDLADAFVVLPGGVGTLEEVIEVMSWQRLNLHDKPIVFLSDTGFWDKLVEVLDDMIKAGFAPETLHDDIESDSSIDAVFETISRRLKEGRKSQPLGGKLDKIADLV
ncbi:TIGR00730 family Rossman fold protein [Litorimonas sp. WD9-15]|uniref:LOG family protein n=1 Tax=Litorimonas sp. WD9-15 TaxID=3418716 RepID=UPI003CFC4C0D